MLLQLLYLALLLHFITSTPALNSKDSLLVHRAIADGSYRSIEEWESHCALSLIYVVTIFLRLDEVLDRNGRLRPFVWERASEQSSEQYPLYNPFKKKHQEWHHIIHSEAYAQFQTSQFPSDEELVDMFPMKNSWKEAKERNPNLNFREWDAQQGGRLCPGADEIKDPEVERIFERLTSVDVPTTFFNKVHSERLANYADQFFAESPCREPPGAGIPFGSAFYYKDIETDDQALWYLYVEAMRYLPADEPMSSETLRGYFTCTGDKTTMQEKLKVELNDFALGTSKFRSFDFPHRGHVTSLFLRKTSIQKQGREIWTLTWIEPNGAFKYRSDSEYKKYMGDVQENAPALFRRLTENSHAFPHQVEIEFITLPTQTEKVAERAVSEHGIQGMFEIRIKLSPPRYNLFRNTNWCTGLLQWIQYWMIDVDNFDLMMISLAIGKLSPRGARTLFESWIQTSMETHVLKHDIHLPVAQIFWPEAAEDESLVYDAFEGHFRVRMNLYLSEKNNEHVKLLEK